MTSHLSLCHPAAEILGGILRYVRNSRIQDMNFKLNCLWLVVEALWLWVSWFY